MNTMNKSKVSQAVFGVLAMWATGHAAADPVVKIDRFPPVTGGGEFVSDVAPEPIKPNVFVVIDNSGSMGSSVWSAKKLEVNGKDVTRGRRNPGERTGGVFNRTQVVAAGVINGFKQLEDRVRLGYMTINHYWNLKNEKPVTKMNTLGYWASIPEPEWSKMKQYNLIPREFSGDYAQAFYQWMAWTYPAGGTPLVNAAEKVISAVEDNTNGGSTPATAPSGAPLDYFSDVDMDKSSVDYGYPLATNPKQSCRANFEIMIADGGYNGSRPNYVSYATGADGYDAKEHQLPVNITVNGQTYSAYVPTDPTYGYNYKDDNANQLSNLALYGWLNDLRPDLTNDVAPYWNAEKVKDSSGKDTDIYQYRDADGNPLPRRQGKGGAEIPLAWDRKNDPATWQHISFFAIGLIEGLQSWKNLKDTYNPLYGLDNEYSIEGYFRAVEDGRIADHKTDNVEIDFAKAGKMGRGDALPVDDPESFQRVIDRIATRINAAYQATLPLKSTISGAVSSTSITSTQEGGSMLYTASVDVEGHSGDVLGYQLCSGRDATCSGSAGTPKWSAADKLYQTLSASGNKGYENVKIYTLKREGNAVTPTEFKWDELSSAQQRAFYTSSEGEHIGKGRVDYIRGKFVRSGAVPGDIDDTQVSADTLDPGIYRPRGRFGKTTGKAGKPDFIGEIVYSQPQYVDNRGTLSNFHPQRSSDAYQKTFLKGQVEARDPLVMFGSNDGKVYTLNGKTGEVVFQYVPLGSYDKLAETTKPGFKGDSLVAGKFEVKDVMFKDGTWHTLAVGSMGAGGKSVFAFDLNKDNLSDPENLILWEKTADSDLGKTLGNVMAKPRIVWLADTTTADSKDGKWVVLIPNGYNSAGNSASLIVLDAQTGDIMAEIDTKAVASGGQGNGLGPLTVQDMDSDGGADFVYAGDLQGNVWKFDLSGWEDDKLDLAYQSDDRLGKLTDYYQKRDEYNTAKEDYHAKVKARDDAKAALDAASAGGAHYAGLRQAYEQAKQSAQQAYETLAKAGVKRDEAYAAIPKGEPLFVAKDADDQRQSITSGITIADSADGEGAMLYFGSGKLLSTDDALQANPQSFYAVYENYRYLSDRTIRNQLDLPLDRDDLFAKEVVTLSSPNSDNDTERAKWVGNFGQLRGIKESAFSLENYAKYDLSGKKLSPVGQDKFGWYIDFPEESYKVYDAYGSESNGTGVRERVVNEPIVLEDGVYFLSFSPRQGAQVKKQASCSGTAVEIKGGDSGITRFYMLDRFSGDYLDAPAFDLSGDGKIDDSDMVTVTSSGPSGSSTQKRPSAALQFTGGYGTLAGAITTLKKTGKNYENENNEQFKSDSLICETERQIIFPSATDANGDPLVLTGCYENRFRVWKQIQQEF